MQANILSHTFHESCPPPHGSDHSAPGIFSQMVFTILRVIRRSMPTRLGQDNAWSHALIVLCNNHDEPDLHHYLLHFLLNQSSGPV